MTEQEWQTCNDPQLMITELLILSDDPLRFDWQVRLFCVACCRLVWDELSEEVQVAERVALGELGPDHLDFCLSEEPYAHLSHPWPLLHTSRELKLLEFSAARGPIEGDDLFYTVHLSAFWAHQAFEILVELWGIRHAGPRPPSVTLGHPWLSEFQAGGQEVNQLMADYLVCIVGNPFRPLPPFNAAWRSPTAVGLAEGIDDDRAFDRMPILADALEDAGCDDASVLSHCRGAAHHTRGCWVVEQILNRTRR